jgi:predicted phosphodiesterase
MGKRELKEYKGLLRSQAQSHSRTQTGIRKQKGSTTILNNIRDYLSINIWGWVIHYFKSRFGGKHGFEVYKDHPGIFLMPDKEEIKIAIAADWATDTIENTKIGERMKAENSDYTIHLGDTYFVGEPKEIASNFIVPGNPWPRGESGTLAIPGNHEFYSNGNSYFEDLLPQMSGIVNGSKGKQEASFFCLENQHWRVLGLDTGYNSVGPPILEWIVRPNAHLEEGLMNWLKEVVQLGKDEKKGLVILTHHQYYSSFEGQFTKPAEQLKELIGDKKEVIWIWGHEHRFAVYGKFKSTGGITAYGRCIGNGGMPIEVASKKSIPASSKIRHYGLVLYDRRTRGSVDGTPVGHNGYSILTFKGDNLTIEHKDESTWILREEWKVDNATGTITGVDAHVNAAVPGITRTTENIRAAVGL